MRIEKAFQLITIIQNRHTTYQELIEFLFAETPPPDHNYLRYDYSSHINEVIKFNGTNTTPVFSVIIPTYNRCAMLLECLASVMRQKNISREKFEIIIVDNGSRDKTEETVRNFAGRGGVCRIIYIKLRKNYGADLARNIAALNSKGDFIAFTDDDCTVPSDWLSEFKRELEADSKIAGVGGWKKPASGKKEPDIYHRFLMWQHFFYPHIRTKSRNLTENRCGLTANVCYQRNIFEKIGGFNPYFKHIGFQEFILRFRKHDIASLHDPGMVEPFARLSMAVHIRKCLAQGWDRYLLHILHPESIKNPSFFGFARRAASDIYQVLSSPKKPPLFFKSFSDIAAFSFLSVITD